MFKYLISKMIFKCQIPSIKDSILPDRYFIGSGSNILNVSLGKYSYIGNNCTIVDSSIGKFCSVSSNVIIGGANHPLEWISTSPVFYSGKNVLKFNFSSHNFNPYKRTKIMNDVWIGSGVFIKSGVTIGNGAVIGMGSVVTKNIGDFEIWAGNPAKFIRYRFDRNSVDKLKKYEWWDMNEKKIKHLAKHINNIDSFILELEKNESSDG
ncbi:TPA: CatB-related O-acetyltransferase [Photobacterium damselae]